MRVVFVGSAPVTIITAEQLIERGHEVIIIESDREVIDRLSDTLDCSFLHGDGSSPDVLREADPKASDVLFCLTEHDQINIIASLVGRSLGFSRAVASISDVARLMLAKSFHCDWLSYHWPRYVISVFLSSIAR